MAKLCESIIAKAIDFSCDDLVVKGLESDGLIINRSLLFVSTTTTERHDTSHDQSEKNRFLHITFI